MGWIAANARMVLSLLAAVAGADVEVEVCAAEDRAIEKPNKTKEKVRGTPIIENSSIPQKTATA
jgi:hypothetical protein